MSLEKIHTRLNLVDMLVKVVSPNSVKLSATSISFR